MIILVKSGKEVYGAFSCTKEQWGHAKKQKKGLWRAAHESRHSEFKSLPSVKYECVGEGNLHQFARSRRLPNWKDYFRNPVLPPHVKDIEVVGKFFKVSHECTGCGKAHTKHYSATVRPSNYSPLCKVCSKNKHRSKTSDLWEREVLHHSKLKRIREERRLNSFNSRSDHGYNIYGQVHLSVHDALNHRDFSESWGNQYGSGVKEINFND